MGVCGTAFITAVKYVLREVGLVWVTMWVWRYRCDGFGVWGVIAWARKGVCRWNSLIASVKCVCVFLCVWRCGCDCVGMCEGVFFTALVRRVCVCVCDSLEGLCA